MARGLKPSETVYVARTRDRRQLRFSRSGKPSIEQAYRTHWLSPELSAGKRERLAERTSRPPDLVVVSPLRDWTFEQCGGGGRSAAGRRLDAHAVELAVAASVRHRDTRYDDLLMAGVDRRDARAQVGADVSSILDRWRQRPS